MLLWFACFGAAAIIIGMVQGLFFWLLLALRFWWVILLGVGLYYTYEGCSWVIQWLAAHQDPDYPIKDRLITAAMIWSIMGPIAIFIKSPWSDVVVDWLDRRFTTIPSKKS
jgi:hypothetical protein